jgi:hypothetical protein
MKAFGTLKRHTFDLGFCVFAAWTYWAHGGLLAVPKWWLLVIAIALVRVGSYFEGARD